LANFDTAALDLVPAYLSSSSASREAARAILATTIPLTVHRAPRTTSTTSRGTFYDEEHFLLTIFSYSRFTEESTQRRGPFAMSSCLSRVARRSVARSLLERAGGSLGLGLLSSSQSSSTTSRSYGVGLPAPKDSEYGQRSLDDGPAMSRAEFQTSQKQVCVE